MTTNGTYDGQDRLVTFGTKTYSYNTAGERTSVVDTGTTPSQTTNYTYDAFGNLKTVTLPNSSVITYLLDAHGRRVRKKTGTTVNAHYVYGKNNEILAVMAANGSISMRFIYGVKNHVPDYMIKGSTKYKIVSNHLGSPVQVMNTSNGTLSQQIKYDEWGNITSDTSPGFQPFGFAGCLYDTDTKLCHFGAREYDATIGRWLSKDPIGFGGGDTNFYGYVMNDPVNFIDPSGLLRNPTDIFDEAINHPNSSSGTSGPGNAFQHCFASCMMTAENGSAAAFTLGHSFETVNNANGQSGPNWVMDVNNNATGRDLGGSCPVQNTTSVDSKKSKRISQYCSSSCSKAGLMFLDMK